MECDFKHFYFQSQTNQGPRHNQKLSKTAEYMEKVIDLSEVTGILLSYHGLELETPEQAFEKEIF